MSGLEPMTTKRQGDSVAGRLQTLFSELPLIGGLPILNFVNSLDWRVSDKPVEHLTSFENLLRWSVFAGILTEREARSLLRVGDVASSSAALRRVVAFPEAAYRTLAAAMAGRVPERSDLRRIDETLSTARTKLTLRFDKGRFELQFPEDADRQLDLPLRKIALSLGDLLTSSDLELLGQCGGPGCGWLFLDSTKNHSRRWCSMESCGNRAKAKRFYNRYFR
jgi:predicted RNA-binding Zn ribbon-like protein